MNVTVHPVGQVRSAQIDARKVFGARTVLSPAIAITEPVVITLRASVSANRVSTTTNV